MFLYFIFLFTFIIGVFAAAFLYHAKKMKSDIIRIKDIEMVVTVRNCSTNRNMDNNHIDHDYNVLFEGIDDCRKIYRSSSWNTYQKYRVGDKAILQEIVYKNKDDIFSEIAFANKNHYLRLEQYNSRNTKDDVHITLNTDIDSFLNKQYDLQHRNRKIFSVLFVIIFIIVAGCFIIDFFDTSNKINESTENIRSIHSELKLDTDEMYFEDLKGDNF